MFKLDLSSLKARFSGEIITPADSAYEQSRNTFAHQGTPAVIVQPRAAHDVATAIAYGRANKLAISVRSGGHSGAGFGTNDGGMVINLKNMQDLEILDKDQHLVRIETGLMWQDVANKLAPHGLVISSGDTKTVGVGGLTLGGGIGWMVRKLGLTIDNLTEAEIVTANGDIVKANAHNHSDLFWAIRGGGGNFGVVTSFTIKSSPLHKITTSSIFFERTNVASFIKKWRDYMRTAPAELTTMLNILPSFNGQPPAIILGCCFASEDAAKATAAIEPMLSLGTLIRQEITQMPYAEALDEAHPPTGMRIIVKNTFIKSLTNDAIAAMAHACEQNDIILQVRGLGGAVDQLDNSATAYAHRGSEALVVSPAFVPPTATDETIAESLKPWQTIAKHGNGSYVNLLSEPWDATLAYPPETMARLEHIKATYDPENIFAMNFNIKPAKGQNE